MENKTVIVKLIGRPTSMKVTKQELVEWIDDEGGWASFMARGGVGEDDVSEDIRAKWVEVIWAWKDFQRAVDNIKRDLPQL